jgi:hypothetical protein
VDVALTEVFMAEIAINLGVVALLLATMLAIPRP